MDQLGFIGVIVALFANPFGFTDAIAESLKAVTKKGTAAVLEFSEWLGKKIAGPIAIFLVVNAVILLGFLFAVNSFDGTAQTPMAIMMISFIAISGAAIYTWILGKSAPLKVSLFWPAFVLVMTLFASSVTVGVHSIVQGNGWVFFIACAMFVHAVVCLKMMAQVGDWIVRKGFKALETGAALVVEPAAAVLPVTTIANAPSRLRNLVDIFDEDKWGAQVLAVPESILLLALPYMIAVSFYINPWWAITIGATYLVGVAAARFALGMKLHDEVEAKQQSFALLMLAFASPLMLAVRLLGGDAIVGWVRGYWNGDTYVVENHGWWMPLLILPVALIVMMVARKWGKESKSRFAAFVTMAAGLVALWSFVAFIVAVKGNPGWTPLAKPAATLVSEDKPTSKTPAPAQTVIVVRETAPHTHAAPRRPTHRAPVRVAKSDAEVEREFDDLARDLGVDTK
jgi:hypothetical protein